MWLVHVLQISRHDDAAAADQGSRSQSWNFEFVLFFIYCFFLVLVEVFS